mgnify:CR=1 FL=1
MSLTDYTDFTDKNDNRLGIDLLRAEGGGRRAEGGELRAERKNDSHRLH